MAYIEAKGIHKTFGKGDAAVHALRGASLSVDKGEMIAVMGKSGSGKSTLLNILGGLMTMDEGELYVDGKKVDFRKKKSDKIRLLGCCSFLYMVLTALPG